MGLTKDDVLKETTSNPALKTELLSSLNDDFVAELKGKGIIVRKPDEEKEFLSNYEKTVIPEKVKAEIGAKVKEVHDQYDEDLLKLTGKKKASTQKTYDFLKEAIEEIKTKQGNGSDPVLADKLKQAEAELEKVKDYVPKEELTKLEQKYFTESINNRLSLALDKKTIAVPAHITEEKAKNDFAATQRSMMKTDFLQVLTPKKDNDGNVVYYDGDKLLTNPQTAKPLTESEIIDKRYAGYFVPEQKSKTGTGTGKGGSTVKDVNEANLKTKADVAEYLDKKLNPQGIKKGSTAYGKEYTRILTDYGITE